MVLDTTGVWITLFFLHRSALIWAFGLRLPLLPSVISSWLPASAPHCTALPEIPDLTKDMELLQVLGAKWELSVLCTPLADATGVHAWHVGMLIQ